MDFSPRKVNTASLHSIDRYLMCTYYVPGTVSGKRDTTWRQSRFSLGPQETYTQWRDSTHLPRAWYM